MTDKAKPIEGEPLLTACESVIRGDALAQMRALVETYAKPDIVDLVDPVTGVRAPATVNADGAKAVPASVFDDYLLAPRFRRGTATLTSLDSLIEHTQRFKDLDSIVFANNDRAAPSLTAVLDYHPIGASSPARHGRHRSAFAFPLSDEWKAWIASNGTVMKMVEFAEFLDERVIDVLHLIPDEDELSEDLQKYIAAAGGDATIATPQKLVELARGLQINESSVVREVAKLSSGEGQVLFQTEHSDGNGEPLRIPNLFLIGIPVFSNGVFYRLAARLRYRKNPGGIVFWYDLWRTDRTFDHAFNEAVERVKIETGLPVLLGKPEA